MRPVTYRAVTQEEFPDFLRAEITAYTDTGAGQEDAFDRFGPVFEPERSVAAFDGSQIVGTLCSFPTPMTVPGGKLNSAGLSFVTTRPTHRRRGILTEMMRQHMDQVKEIGEPTATLHASESSIYGRFGYGIASHFERFKIQQPHAVFRDEYDIPGEVVLVDLETAKQVIPSAYALAARTRPGTYERDQTYWDLRFWPIEIKKMLIAAYQEAGETLGYVIYNSSGNWQNWIPKKTLVVEEMVTTTPAAHRALWEYLFGIDVIESITAGNRPIDDPLPWLLRNPRRLERLSIDSVWNRILDVPAALEARRYAHDGGLTIEVIDEWGGWGAGTFRLEGGPLGATCTSSTELPDLTMTVEDLGAIYLGGVKPSVLAASGRIAGNTSSAVATADSMFGWSSMPWCPAIEPQI